MHVVLASYDPEFLEHTQYTTTTCSIVVVSRGLRILYHKTYQAHVFLVDYDSHLRVRGFS